LAIGVRRAIAAAEPRPAQVRASIEKALVDMMAGREDCLVWRRYVKEYCSFARRRRKKYMKRVQPPNATQEGNCNDFYGFLSFSKEIKRPKEKKGKKKFGKRGLDNGLKWMREESGNVKCMGDAPEYIHTDTYPSTWESKAIISVLNCK